MLVLADGHCLATHALAACGKPAPQRGTALGPLHGALNGTMQAATLETLVNLVAAGYGATLIPGAGGRVAGRRGIALRPLAGGRRAPSAWPAGPGFPRPQALRALEKVIRRAIKPQQRGLWAPAA
jgi:LysR family hydrogen peroxide-inducible transcriptional activator